MEKTRRNENGKEEKEFTEGLELAWELASYSLQRQKNQQERKTKQYQERQEIRLRNQADFFRRITETSEELKAKSKTKDLNISRSKRSYFF